LAPKKISAKEVIIDIKAGLSNDEIAEKYGLSEKGTQSLFDRLLDRDLLTREEYDHRLTSSIQSIDPGGDNGGSASQKEATTDESTSPLTKPHLLRETEVNAADPNAGATRVNEPAEPARQASQSAQEPEQDRTPASPEFIDVSKQGKNQWWRYLVGILFIIFFSTMVAGSVGGVLGFVLKINAQLDKTTGSFIGVDSLTNYILLNLSFPFIFAAILLAVRYEHKRPVLSLITPNQSIDWKKIGKSFGIFWGLLLCVLAVDHIMNPADFQFSFDPGRFLPFALVVLVLTPIQTTAEELFFRGYLLQMIALLTRNRAALVFVSGVLFMLPHLFNPEVASGFLPMSLYYFAIGGFLTLVTLKSNSLEVAIGIHGAVNLFSALVVNYANSSLKTESIFFCSAWDPVSSLVSFCVIAIVFYLLMFGGRLTRQKTWIVWPRTL
jgi:uncharacterized protein